MHIIVDLYIMFMNIIALYVVGYLLFKDFCEHLPEDEQIPEINFYDEVRFIIPLNIYQSSNVYLMVWKRKYFYLLKKK